MVISEIKEKSLELAVDVYGYDASCDVDKIMRVARIFEKYLREDK